MEEIFLMTFLNSSDSVESVLETFSGILDALHVGRVFRILVSFSAEVPSDFSEKFYDLLQQRNFNPDDFFLHFISMVDLCRVVDAALVELQASEECVTCNENDLLPRTVFAQDQFSVLEGEAGINYILNMIYAYLNFSEGYVGPALIDQAFAFDYGIRPCALTFNGGNVLAGEDFLLIGRDTITSNADTLGLESVEVLERFRQYYGVAYIHEIGSPTPYPTEPNFSQGRWQPVFHLDMYLTLGGPINKAGADREEVVFVGKLQILPAENEAKSEEEGEEILQMVRKVAKNLDRTALGFPKQLSAEIGITVLRFPLLLDLETGYYISWNNCLVENMGPGHKRTVYLPDYCTEPDSRYEPYQQQVIDVLEKAGFDYVLVNNDFLKYSLQYRGSLHCMVKVLRRGKFLAD
ncbi:MAG: hypothetical protein AAF570_13210 [Bacteroidota bacterium]